MSRLQKSYPQLSRKLAILQLAENSKLSPSELQDSAHELCQKGDHNYLTPSSAKLSPSELLTMALRVEELHSKISSLDSEGSGLEKLEFDKRVTEEILDIFPLDLYQASMKTVWSFITLRCLPGVASWRFPNKSNHPDFERYLGHERNTFQRLWYRAHLLGPELSIKLSENDLIQMFERGTTIGSNPIILRTLAEQAIARRAEIEAIGGKTSDFVSESAKILKRELVVVTIAGMPEEEQKQFVKDKTEKALVGLRAAKA